MTSKSDAISQLRSRISQIEATPLDFTKSEAARDGSSRSKKERIQGLRAQMASIQPDVHASDSSFAPDDSQDANQCSGERAEELSAEAAFQKIIRWTSRRFRSEHDVRKRLQNAGFGAQQCDESIERAKRCLLLDDVRYADILIRSRVRQGKGASGIEYELKQEGIDCSCVPGWPEEYLEASESSEIDRAVAFLNTKTIRAKDQRGAAYRKLVQKGYSSSVACAAARLWSDAG